MAGSFQGYASELVGMLRSRLPYTLAQTFVNRAYHDIQESRLWSFNLAECILNAPQIVQTGSVTVTQYSDQVVADATAAAVWTTLANPLITLRQFRVGSGPIYNISAFDGVNTLTLDRVYNEAGGAGLAYSIYRCYYTVPFSNFLRWESIFDPINAWNLGYGYSKSDVDKWDPQRTSLQMPYKVAFYKSVSVTAPAGDPLAGQTVPMPQFEMWPHPTVQNGYQCLYVNRGKVFVNPTDSPPPPISDEMIIFKSLYYAYQWAEINKGAYPDWAEIEWMGLMAEAKVNYAEELQKHRRQDEETVTMNFSRYYRGNEGPFPLTGAYLSSHDGGGLFE